MPKTLVYGQVACPEGQVQMCLSRYRELGEIIRWDNGTEWRLVERYPGPLAGGYYVSVNCSWFRAELVRHADSSPIEQELIDGTVYWDSIALNWKRLQVTATHDVLGTYRQNPHPMTSWDAHAHNPPSFIAPNRESRTFNTEADARLWIETRAKAILGGAHA